MKRKDILSLLDELLARAPHLDAGSELDPEFCKWKQDAHAILSSAWLTSSKYLTHFASLQFGYVQDEHDPRTQINNYSKSLSEAVCVLRKYRNMVAGPRYCISLMFGKLGAVRVRSWLLTSKSIASVITKSVLLPAVGVVIGFVIKEWVDRTWIHPERPPMYITAEWVSQDVFVGEFRPNPDFRAIVSKRPMSEGLKVDALFKIANATQSPLTIDDLKWCWPAENGDVSWSDGHNFRDPATHNRIRLPTTLGAGEQLRAVAAIPMPVADSLATVLATMTPKRSYNSLLVAFTLAKFFMRMETHKDTFALAVQIGEDGSRFPELIQRWSDLKGVTRRGDRRIKLVIRLATGQRIEEIIDFIDIDRTPDDY